MNTFLLATLGLFSCPVPPQRYLPTLPKEQMVLFHCCAWRHNCLRCSQGLVYAMVCYPDGRCTGNHQQFWAKTQHCLLCSPAFVWSPFLAGINGIGYKRSQHRKKIESLGSGDLKMHTSPSTFGIQECLQNDILQNRRKKSPNLVFRPRPGANAAHNRGFHVIARRKFPNFAEFS